MSTRMIKSSRAVNDYGASDWLLSPPMTAKEPWNRPGRPDKPRIKGATRDSMTVYWDPPEENGGAMVTSYVMEKRSRLNRNWRKATTEKIFGTQFRASCLQEGQEYVFRVAAVNQVGQGDFSQASLPAFAVLAVNCPGAPGPAVTEVGETWVTLEWAAPEDDGGSKILSYFVEKQLEGNVSFTSISGNLLLN